MYIFIYIERIYTFIYVEGIYIYIRKKEKRRGGGKKENIKGRSERIKKIITPIFAELILTREKQFMK